MHLALPALAVLSALTGAAHAYIDAIYVPATIAPSHKFNIIVHNQNYIINNQQFAGAVGAVPVGTDPANGLGQLIGSFYLGTGE
jgi:hypothetical protein